jgi:hypothetical protein
MMWWWYDIRSGYAAAYRDPESIEGVAAPSLVLMPEPAMDSEEISLLKERSEQDRLMLETMPTEDSDLFERINTYINGLK